MADERAVANVIEAAIALVRASEQELRAGDWLPVSQVEYNDLREAIREYRGGKSE